MPLRLAFLLPLVALAACDFTPTLDIDLPEHERATVINAVLAVDSVATVRLGVSSDPYTSQPQYTYYGAPQTDPNAVVTLLRDGQPVERLRVRPLQCESYDYRTGQNRVYECGPFVGTVPLEEGATYTVRAEVPGLPTAEGTVTMPRRPSVSVDEIERGENERRRFRVRVTDPPGQGNRYGVALLAGPYRYASQTCDYATNPPTCRDTTVVQPRQLVGFSSADPTLLAASRDLDLENNTFRFVTVDDNAFDGQTWTFTMTESYGFYYGYERARGGEGPRVTVQIAGLSGDVYDAYQIATFGGQGEDNPFVEPINLPSNVTGGYGLVGGIALAEVSFEAPPSSPDR